MSGSTSYSVSANLHVRGNAQAEIRRIAQALTALDKQVTGLGNKLSATIGQIRGLQQAVQGLSGFSGVAAQRLRGLQAAVQAVGGFTSTTTRNLRNLQQAVQGVSGFAGSTTARLNAQAAAFQASARAASQAAVAYGQLAATQARLAQTQRPGRVNLQPHGGRGGGGDDDDHVRRGRRDQSRFTRSLTDPTASQAGGLMSMLGRDVTAVLRQGAAEADTENLLRAQQYSPDTIARFRQQAIQMSRANPAASVREGLGAIIESLGITGNSPEGIEQALQIAPHLLRTATLAARLQGPGADVLAGLEPIRKLLGSSGRFSTPDQKFDLQGGLALLQQVEAGLIAGASAVRPDGKAGGVQPRELQMFAQQAGIPFRLMDIEEFSGPVMSLLQEASGQRVATMYEAMNAQFFNGQMAKNLIPTAQKLDMVYTGDAAHDRRLRAEVQQRIQGLVQAGRMTPEAATRAMELEDQPMIGPGVRFAGRGLQAVRPSLYTEEMLGNRLQEARNGDTDTPRKLRDLMTRMFASDPRLGEDDIAAIMNQLGSRATGRRGLQQLGQTREIGADEKRVRDIVRAMRSGQDPTGQVINGPTGQLGNVATQFEGLLAAIGNNPAVGPFLSDLSKGFMDLAASIRENPAPFAAFIEELRKFLSALRAFVTNDLPPIISALTATLNTIRGIASAPGALGKLNAADDAVVSGVGKFWNWLRGGGSGTTNFGPATDAGARALGLPTGSELRGPGGDPRSNGVPVTPGTEGQIIDITPGPRSDLQLQNFNPGSPTGASGGQLASIYLDGRRVGEGVFPYLAQSMGGPASGAGRFDPRRNLVPADISIA